jgi:RNA polymerase sigma-70 factor (ECF subfamily)
MPRRATGAPAPQGPWAETSEEDLLRGVIARKPGAWQGFYRRYERLVISCIKKVLHRYTAVYGDEDIEDMVNTVCLNLVKDDYRKLRTYDPRRGYKLSSWVGLIATNTALDALRRREPIHGTLTPSHDDDEAPAQIADEGPDPGVSMERREQWRALLVAIRELPENDREFLELYYDQELEPEELAKRMNIAVNTVYSRKNKVREKLRRIIETLEGGKIAATGA